MAAQTIAVIGETREGALIPEVAEVVALAQQLAGGNGRVAGILAGSPEVEYAAQGFFALGAQEAYAAAHPALAFPPDPEAHAAALLAMCRRADAGVVLIPQTPYGRSIAPLLAYGLQASLLMNCIGARWADGSGTLEVDCPVYGGAATATYRCSPGAAVVLCVSPGAIAASPAQAAASGGVVAVSVTLEGAAPRVRVTRRAAGEGQRLESARIIVAGGAGLQSQENWRRVTELAALLGGVPAASKQAIVAGWATPAHKVGLTGTTVAPDLYLAVGISGASQHMVGCSRAKTIVAVNTDRQAPVFRHAKYGVVADAGAFLPAFLAACKDMQK